MDFVYIRISTSIVLENFFLEHFTKTAVLIVPSTKVLSTSIHFDGHPYSRDMTVVGHSFSEVILIEYLTSTVPHSTQVFSSLHSFIGRIEIFLFRLNVV